MKGPISTGLFLCPLFFDPVGENALAQMAGGSEPAPASRQVGRRGGLSDSSLLHRHREPHRRYRGRGVLFQLGARSTRSRKSCSGVLV